MATAAATQDPPDSPVEPSAGETLPVTPHSLSRAVHARRAEYVGRHRTRVKIGTWNVAACPGTDKDLARWFVESKSQGVEDKFETLNLSPTSPTPTDSGDNGIGLYILGLQEIVDLNLTKEYMTRAVYTDNSATAKWQAAIEAALPHGYQLVVAEQMFGLLLLIYASPDIAPTVSSVSTKQIGTGMGGWFANKGAVSTRLVLGETTRLVLVNCHLASGATPANLDRRCFDAKQILSRTEFDPIVQAGVEEDDGRVIDDADFAFWFGDLNFRLDGLPGDDIRRLLMLHARGEYGAGDSNASRPEGDGVIIMRDSTDSGATGDTVTESSLHSQTTSSDSDTLPDPDDFPEDPSQDPTSLQATLDSLIPHDQLRRIIRDRKGFHDGWKEGAITFLPTYKYDVGTVGLFDSSEKQRAPSWCDRILYRTRKDRDEYESKIREEEATRKKDEEMRSRGLEEDDDVLFTYDTDEANEGQPPKPTQSFEYNEYDEYDENEDPEPEEFTGHDGGLDRISLDFYTSNQNITSSDHKPVISMFTIDYNAVIPELKSKVYAEVARELDRVENEGRPAVTVISETGSGSEEIAVDFGEVQFLERKVHILTIANTGGVAAKLAFVDKPNVADGDDEDHNNREWLSVVFSSPDHSDSESAMSEKAVVLEPGETVSARVTAHVSSIPLVRALNDKTAEMDDVLVLRVEDGRDHFIPVRGQWQPSCFGRSMDELIRVPDGGIRQFIADKGIEGSIPYDMDQKMSAPQELFKITTAMEDLVERCLADETMLGDIAMPQAAGWPLDASTWTMDHEELEAHGAAIAAALDTAQPLVASLPLEMPSPQKLEILSAVLVLFLSSLTDGIVPVTLWLKLNSALPPNLSTVKDARLKVLDVLSESPSHNISLVFLTTALGRIATELTPATPLPQRRLSFRRGNAEQMAEQGAIQRRKAKERRFAELIASAVCRSGPNEKDKATRERQRAVMEVCLRLDDG